MNSELFSPDVVPLLQGIKPFLPQKSSKLINGTLSIIDMLSSAHGKTALESLGDLFLSTGSKSSRNNGRQEIDSDVFFGLGLAFALFLVLILLVFGAILIFYDPDPPADAGEGPGDG